jgi:hypothetical protein
LNEPVSVAMALDTLMQLERNIKDLRRSGRVDKVLQVLAGDGTDVQLVEKLNEMEGNSAVWSRVEEIWNDEKMLELQLLKDATVQRLQDLMNIELQNCRLKLPIATAWKQKMRECLKVYSFICLLRLRDTSYSQRKDWKRLYKQVEKVKELRELDYRDSPEEKEWLQWIDSEYLNEDIPSGRDNSASDIQIPKSLEPDTIPNVLRLDNLQNLGRSEPNFLASHRWTPDTQALPFTQSPVFSSPTGTGSPVYSPLSIRSPFLPWRESMGSSVGSLISLWVPY